MVKDLLCDFPEGSKDQGSFLEVGDRFRFQVVALIAARLSGSSVQVRYRRHCKVSSDGRNPSRQTDCQGSDSSGLCRGLYIVRGDGRGEVTRSLTSFGGDGDLLYC